MDAAALVLRETWQQGLLSDPYGLRVRLLDLPEQVWSTDAELLVALVYCYRDCADSHPVAVVPYLDAADACLTTEDEHRGLGMLLDLARAASLRDFGRFDDALAVARGVEAVLVGAKGLPLTLRIELAARATLEVGMSLALAGQLDAAGVHLANGLGLWGDRPADALVVEALGCLALVAYFCGTAQAPLIRVDEGTARARQSGLLGRPCTSALLLCEAMLAIDAGQLNRAAQLLDRAEPLANGTPYELLCLHARALLVGAGSSALEQLERLAEIQHAIKHWQQSSLVRLLHDSTRVLALTQAGSVAAARDAIEAIPEMPDGDSHAVCTAWLAGRVAIHTGHYEAALEVTAQCRALGDSHAPRALAFVDAVRSAAHQCMGDLVCSAETIDRALLQASRSGWRRHLTMLPPDVLELALESARSRSQSPQSLAVIDDLGSSVSRAAVDPIESIEPLSSRERLVLGHIVRGMSRQEISSQLQVSPNTVKTQTRNIYRKLGASNRHEAIDRAAKYGLMA